MLFLPSSKARCCKKGTLSRGKNRKQRKRRGLLLLLLFFFLFSGKWLRVRPCVFACAEKGGGEKIGLEPPTRNKKCTGIHNSFAGRKSRETAARSGMKYFQKLGRRRRGRKLSLPCFAASVCGFFCTQKMQNAKEIDVREIRCLLGAKNCVSFLSRSVIGGNRGG